jgi:hypothetical protein
VCSSDLTALSATRSELNEESFEILIHKALDLYETQQIRHGVSFVSGRR